MRKLAQLVLWLTLLGSGGYVFVYLYRWEWQRAQVALGFFLATEVAVAATLLVGRIGRTRPPDDHGAVGRLRRRIQDSPPEPAPFRWLLPRPDRTSVFIPILLGAGVVAAALAWAVERVAAATARSGVERDLAEDLTAIDFPESLVPDDEALLASNGESSVDAELQRLLRPGGDRP